MALTTTPGEWTDEQKSLRKSLNQYFEALNAGHIEDDAAEHFNRDKYKIGPKYTEGWLSRVQQLAPVVAEDGTIEISIFAKPAETKAAGKP